MERPSTENHPEHSRKCDGRRSLVECFRNIFREGILTDVTFRVGEERVEMNAHKLVLSARSPVFFAMFNGAFESKDVIDIEDSEADEFKLFLGFLYTDEIEISSKNVHGILHLACKYDVQLLFDKAVHNLIEDLSIENACSMVAVANTYTLQELKLAALNYICLNAKECLKTESFLQLNSSDAEDIARCNGLPCSEEFLFESLCEWAEQKCQDKKMDVTDENKRNVLGKLLYTVRFPLMKYDYITGKLSNQKICTDSEIVTILQLHKKKDEEDSDVCETNTFPAHARKSMTYDTLVLVPSGEYSLSLIDPCKEEINVVFELSADSWFYGAMIYGPNEETRFCFELTLMCVESNTQIARYSTAMTSDNRKYTCDILLDVPVYLRRTQKYSCSVDLFTTFLSEFYYIEKVFPVIEKKSKQHSTVYNVSHEGSFVEEKPEKEKNPDVLPELTFRHKTVTLHAKTKIIAGLLLF